MAPFQGLNVWGAIGTQGVALGFTLSALQAKVSRESV